jgi:PAS domain S-box-containing protein
MSFNGIVVSSYDPDGKLLTCEYALSNGQPLDVSVLPKLPLNPTGSGMQSKVVLSGRSEIFDVARKTAEPGGRFMHVGPDNKPRAIDKDRPPVTQTAMMAPMLLEDQVTGVVQVMSDEPDAYTEADLQLLDGLALLMTAAANNAKLYQSAQSAQQALAASERRLRTFIDLMPQIAWVTRVDGEGEDANQVYYDYTGLPNGASPSETWRDVVHPDDAARVEGAFKRCMASLQPLEQELRIRRHDGEYRWFLSRLVPILSPSGEVERWLGTSTDIHDQKSTEAELESRVADRTAQLTATMRELEGFTYAVSHDLRASIRGMSVTSKMLELDHGAELSEDARALVRTQMEAAKNMSTLVDELLRLAKITRGEVKKENFDISSLVNEVVQEIESGEWAGRVSFRVETGLKANGDPRLLRLVLLNLFENAAKFSPDGGTVEFGRAQGEFFVRDSGVGFDPTYTAKLFLPFERLVHDHEFPGTGIGLANVQRIVHRHGGEVRAKSRPGEGATFYFHLG